MLLILFYNIALLFPVLYHRYQVSGLILQISCFYVFFYALNYKIPVFYDIDILFLLFYLIILQISCFQFNKIDLLFLFSERSSLSSNPFIRESPLLSPHLILPPPLYGTTWYSISLCPPSILNPTINHFPHPLLSPCTYATTPLCYNPPPFNSTIEPSPPLLHPSTSCLYTR